ncbi:MAG: tetratricopeptide repeat protein [Myxococcota bacterium]
MSGLHYKRMSLTIVLGTAIQLAGCAGVPSSTSTLTSAGKVPLTVSRALGHLDSTRDASLRLVIAGLDADTAGRPGRALASYQRAVRVDPTNPFAFLALARHHLEGASVDEAGAFLDQARSLFENSRGLGDAFDTFGIGLRAGIARERGRGDEAALNFELARILSPEIWNDEWLSPAELR